MRRCPDWSWGEPVVGRPGHSASWPQVGEGGASRTAREREVSRGVVGGDGLFAHGKGGEFGWERRRVWPVLLGQGVAAVARFRSAHALVMKCLRRVGEGSTERVQQCAPRGTSSTPLFHGRANRGP